MRYAVVVACSKEWIPYACVTLLSAHSNLSAYADYYLISDSDASDVELKPLTRAKEEFGANLEPRRIDGNAFQNIETGNFSRSTLYRLALPEVLPDAYDRVLYLDSDVLVLDNIDNLINFDLQGFPVGAVEDIGMYDEFNKFSEEMRRGIGFDRKEPYFNSGVMVFDWKKALREQILPNAREILTRNKLMFLDQDALNIVLKGNWAALPIEYNVMTRTASFIEKRTVRHFTRDSKPWAKRYKIEDSAYRKHYHRTLKLLGCGGLISRSELVDDCIGLIRRLDAASRRARRGLVGCFFKKRESDEQMRIERLRKHILSTYGAERENSLT